MKIHSLLHNNLCLDLILTQGIFIARICESLVNKFESREENITAALWNPKSLDDPHLPYNGYYPKFASGRVGAK